MQHSKLIPLALSICVIVLIVEGIVASRQHITRQPALASAPESQPVDSGLDQSTPTPIMQQRVTFTPTPTVTPSRTPTPTPTPPLYYVRNQVIVTGPVAEVEQIVGASQLIRLDRVSLSYLARVPPRTILRFPPAKRGEVVMDLYHVGSDSSVAEMVRRLNAQAVALQLNVYADPNYLTGPPPVTIAGNPWHIEGGPVGTQGGQAGSNLFRSQWAFGPAGIRLIEGQNRTVPYTGKGVRVGVFDTSPFSDLVPNGASGHLSFEGLALTVSHPNPIATLVPPVGGHDVSDHGLFVSGLIHAVAPDSDIGLVRVLDQYGQGDLETLNKALSTFITQTITLSDTLGQVGGVINLSLGVHQPPDPQNAGLPPEIVSLQTLVAAAHGFGIVVVAASGNDSSTGPALPMQLPASNTYAVGVAASTISRGRGCFSNKGKLGAPGGDGSQPDCQPKMDDCPAQPQYCLISLARSSPTHYAYWTGTSFATPLVSGLAALILKNRGGKASDQIADRVAGIIYSSADLIPTQPDLGAGIIDVHRALLPNSIYLPLGMKNLP